MTQSSARIQLNPIMPTPGQPWPRELWPDMTDLVTEDDTPVDNLFSEKQQRLLTEPLYNAWPGPEDGFLTMANVGLFYDPNESPLVPDALLSLHVRAPNEPWPKHHRSYFVWVYGKVPDVVIEVVSNREGGEDSRKLGIYANIGIPYYIIYDPERHLGDETLRRYVLHHGSYLEQVGGWLPTIGLGLDRWDGEFEGMRQTWLRWYDRQGVLPTGQESTQRETVRAEREMARAEREMARAEREMARAERLAAHLRSLGIDPDSLD